MKNIYKKAGFNLLRLLGDFCIIGISFLLPSYIRYGQLPTSIMEVQGKFVPYIIIFSLIIFYMLNLYKDQTKKPIREILSSFIPSSIIIILFAMSLSYFTNYKLPEYNLLLTFPILIIFMTSWRYFTINIQKIFESPKEVIIIGSEVLINKLQKNIRLYTNNGYNIIKTFNKEQLHNYNENELKNKLTALEPDSIFITSDVSIDDKRKLFCISLKKDWEISLIPEFYEIMITGGTLVQIGEFPIYNIKSLKLRNGTFSKRIVDITLSLIGLLITLPITLPVSILIKATTKGPIFYKQTRVSQNKDEFKVYKFRTMVQNAEKNTGPILSNKNDTRVTKIGSFLRKTRLDEIPQLINVLKGEMSLIGPRPERPHFVNKFENEIQDYEFRHHIKAGITGLAQINGFYSSAPEEKLRMDLIYANNNNLLFDFKILLNTIKVIFLGENTE